MGCSICLSSDIADLSVVISNQYSTTLIHNTACQVQGYFLKCETSNLGLQDICLSIHNLSISLSVWKTKKVILESSKERIFTVKN
jgi:hypothetical protein